MAGLMDEVDRFLGCWAPLCSYPLHLILVLVGKNTLPKSEGCQEGQRGHAEEWWKLRWAVR